MIPPTSGCPWFYWRYVTRRLQTGEFLMNGSGDSLHASPRAEPAGAAESSVCSVAGRHAQSQATRLLPYYLYTSRFDATNWHQVYPVVVARLPPECPFTASGS